VHRVWRPTRMTPENREVDRRDNLKSRPGEIDSASASSMSWASRGLRGFVLLRAERLFQ
jgi:hypothetical protein